MSVKDKDWPSELAIIIQTKDKQLDFILFGLFVNG